MNASLPTRTQPTPMALLLSLASLLALEARAQVPEPGNALYNQTSNVSTWIVDSTVACRPGGP